MSRDVMAEIQNETTENKICLYIKGSASMPRCGFSAAVVEILDAIGKPYKAVNVLEDPEKWEAVKVYTNWPTIPQLYVNGEFVGGCDITREMYASGELEPMIEQAFAG